MKAASVSEIKAALKSCKPAEVTELCLRLARYKKENKELLSFLLFEADELEQYVNNVQEETEELFKEVNTTNLFWAKKTIRKILRLVNKHIKYTGSKTAEPELLIHFCKTLKDSKITYTKSPALLNLYNNQVKKIDAAIESLHEDLQHDYIREREKL